MPYRKSKGWGNTKPPFGVPIIGSLADALDGSWQLNEPAGTWHNGAIRITSGSDLTVGAATVKSAPLLTGMGLKLSAGGYLAGTNPLPGTGVGDNGKGPFTIAVRFRFPGTPPTNCGILSLGSTATSGAPLYLLQCATGPIVRCLLGDVAYVTVIASPVANTWYDIVSTQSAAVGVAGTEEHWVNGVRQYSGARTVAMGANTTNANIYVGSGFSTQVDCDVEFVRLWHRVLNPSEISQMYVTPYAMFAPPRRRIISGSGAVAASKLLLHRRRKASAA